MAAENQQNVGWFKGFIQKIVNVVISAAKDTKKLGKEDPRRIIHSFKVGLAITLVSLFYYFDFLYEGFGVFAMWTVMTVVVVFEFSVGATLGKGVNRGVATLLGGALGVGAHRLASFTGDKVERIMLCLSVSSQGVRDDEVLEMARRRLSTILIGGLATVFVCIFICQFGLLKIFIISLQIISKNSGIFLEGI